MREEKQLLLDEIHGLIEQYGSFVITQYERINANKISEFRNEIAEIGGNVEMVPKRILLKAAEESGITLRLEDLPGHIGLVFTGSDTVESAKKVCAFSKSTDKALQVIGGRIDGKLLRGEDVEKLSTLPALPEMRSQLLAVLQAPLQETLGAMNAILTSVLYCLEEKSKEKKSGE